MGRLRIVRRKGPKKATRKTKGTIVKYYPSPSSLQNRLERHARLMMDIMRAGGGPESLPPRVLKNIAKDFEKAGVDVTPYTNFITQQSKEERKTLSRIDPKVGAVRRTPGESPAPYGRQTPAASLLYRRKAGSAIVPVQSDRSRKRRYEDEEERKYGLEPVLIRRPVAGRPPVFAHIQKGNKVYRYTVPPSQPGGLGSQIMSFFPLASPQPQQYIRRHYPGLSIGLASSAGGPPGMSLPVSVVSSAPPSLPVSVVAAPSAAPPSLPVSTLGSTSSRRSSPRKINWQKWKDDYNNPPPSMGDTKIHQLSKLSGLSNEEFEEAKKKFPDLEGLDLSAIRAVHRIMAENVTPGTTPTQEKVMELSKKIYDELSKLGKQYSPAPPTFISIELPSAEPSPPPSPPSSGPSVMRIPAGASVSTFSTTSVPIPPSPSLPSPPPAAPSKEKPMEPRLKLPDYPPPAPPGYSVASESPPQVLYRERRGAKKKLEFPEEGVGKEEKKEEQNQPSRSEPMENPLLSRLFNEPI